ncbi:hypothetical protein [Sporosarcina limicola]|uniref:Lactate dehydrogenase-like 2-hydroxyacid dehydrogenase n=1 Tax=Sporosarcina limicola TaxID=34101 RepID=A0A927MJL0_9BACL|nr:hypothetical protein [Sporosarcina limicola]MBE1555803.1 lactate dehydrogenase-like 2-hydroxyacid dehydrogenase [Sporosarcina limicola]
MKPRIYITRKLDNQAVNPLQKNFDVGMWESESESVPRDILLQEVVEVDG